MGREEMKAWRVVVGLIHNFLQQEAKEKKRYMAQLEIDKNK